MRSFQYRGPSISSRNSRHSRQAIRDEKGRFRSGKARLGRHLPVFLFTSLFAAMAWTPQAAAVERHEPALETGGEVTGEIASRPSSPGLRRGCDHCARYARSAISANLRNKRHGCGFTGHRWSSDFDHHYDWCTKVDRTRLHSESQAREDMLERCTGLTTAEMRICTTYARSAIRNNGTNKRRGCGFTGPRWRSDFDHHFDWCKNVDRTRLQTETQARENKLKACAAEKSKRKYCRGYADGAILANRTNKRNGCGFTGPRWRSDFDHHYHWCMKVSRKRSKRETRARRDQLLKKCG